jgi:hypothetical protein
MTDELHNFKVASKHRKIGSDSIYRTFKESKLQIWRVHLHTSFNFNDVEIALKDGFVIIRVLSFLVFRFI